MFYFIKHLIYILETVDPNDINKALTFLENNDEKSKHTISFEMKILYDTIHKLINVVKYGINKTSNFFNLKIKR